MDDLDLDLICYVDIGLTHLGVVSFYFPSLQTEKLLEILQKQSFRQVTAKSILSIFQATSSQTIDLTTLKHELVTLDKCPLEHSNEWVDRCLHLFQEYPLFKQCSRLVLERQPMLGLIVITNLFQREFRDKTVLIHPSSVQKLLGTRGKSYEERKELATIEAMDYVPESVDPELHAVGKFLQSYRRDKIGYSELANDDDMPRVHDRADAVMLALWDIEHNLLPMWKKNCHFVVDNVDNNVLSIISRHFHEKTAHKKRKHSGEQIENKRRRLVASDDSEDDKDSEEEQLKQLEQFFDQFRRRKSPTNYIASHV